MLFDVLGQERVGLWSCLHGLGGDLLLLIGNVHIPFLPLAICKEVERGGLGVVNIVYNGGQKPKRTSIRSHGPSVRPNGSPIQLKSHPIRVTMAH